MRKCDRIRPANTNVIEKGGEQGALGTKLDISMQPVVVVCVSMKPMEDYSGAAILPAAMLRQVDMPERKLQEFMGSSYYRKLMIGPVTCGGNNKSSLFLRDYTL